MIHIGPRGLAVFLSALIVMTGCEETPGGPPSHPEAAAAALRLLLREAANPFTTDNPACVAMVDAVGITDFPGDPIDDVMAKNPGLRPVSACAADEDASVYYIGDDRLRAPLLHCGEMDARGVQDAASQTVALRCGIRRGLLNGTQFGFDVTRNDAGEIVAIPNGKSWVE